MADSKLKADDRGRSEHWHASLVKCLTPRTALTVCTNVDVGKQVFLVIFYIAP